MQTPVSAMNHNVCTRPSNTAADHCTITVYAADHHTKQYNTNGNTLTHTRMQKSQTIMLQRSPSADIPNQTGRDKYTSILNADDNPHLFQKFLSGIIEGRMVTHKLTQRTHFDRTQYWKQYATVIAIELISIYV